MKLRFEKHSIAMVTEDKLAKLLICRPCQAKGMKGSFVIDFLVHNPGLI